MNMPEETTSANSELVKFILEARKRGFDDYQIRLPLLDNGWPLNEIQKAFYEIKLQEDKKLKKKGRVSGGKTIYVYKNTVTIHLDNEVLKMIEKRAKKNMLTVPEQIEDIIRRSCVNTKKNSELKDDVDDLFLKLFSRKRSGRPKTEKN